MSASTAAGPAAPARWDLLLLSGGVLAASTAGPLIAATAVPGLATLFTVVTAAVLAAVLLGQTLRRGGARVRPADARHGPGDPGPLAPPNSRSRSDPGRPASPHPLGEP